MFTIVKFPSRKNLQKYKNLNKIISFKAWNFLKIIYT